MRTLDRRTLIRGIAAAPVAVSLPRLVRAQGGEYESLRLFMPDQVLPPDLISGEYFQVVGQVTALGYSNRYTLRTDFELEEPVTEDLLTKRVHEAAAIAEILKVKETRAFGSGMASALKSPYKAVKALVTDPVDTLMGVPEGLWKLTKRLGEMISGDRGSQEDMVAAELVGFSTVKRKIAFKLGVDVYSANRRLQQEMNDVAFAGFAGGFTMNLALGAITMPSGLAQAVNAAELARSANQIIRDSAPEDLRIRNRDSLMAMGATKKQINRFMDNKVYTPRHETIITLALENMDGVQNRFLVLRRARRAKTLIDAQLMQRNVEMMSAYHAVVEPVVSIEDVGGELAMRTESGGLVMAMPADRLHWTAFCAGVADALASHPGERGIVVAGDVSDWANRELVARGLTVTKNRRAELLPVEEWAPPELEVIEPPEGEEGEETAPDQA